MKRKTLQYTAGLFFTTYGIYVCTQAVRALIKFVRLYPRIAEALNNADSPMYMWGFLVETIMAILELLYAAACIWMGLSRRTWKFILTCGMLGMATYLCALLEAAIFSGYVTVFRILSICAFMLVPLGIIFFALRSKKAEKNGIEGYYEPVATLIKVGVSACGRVKQEIKQNKIAWQDADETTKHNENPSAPNQKDES